MKRRHSWLVALAILGANAAANAEAPLDVPMTAPHVLATMEKTHVNLKLTPNNPLMKFSIAAPKTWAYSKKFGPVPTGPLSTQGLGFIAPSAAPDAPVIAVTVTPVPFEIPIDAWARLSFAHEGWKIVSAKWFPGPFGLFFDITGTRVTKGEEEVRRTSVHADGANIFSVNCMTGRKHWDEVKEIFWTAHVTFERDGATKQTQMETWNRATAKRPDFEAAYPASWSAETVAASDEGISAVDIRLLDDKQQTLRAYLQIKAERGGAPLSKLRETALAKLGKAGFTPTGTTHPTTEAEDPRAIAVNGWLGGFVGQGKLGGSDVTIRMGFVKRPGVMFSLVVLGPTAANDPLLALRAQRAFEIARSTVGPAK